MPENAVVLRFIGFFGCLFLTLAAYFLIVQPQLFYLDSEKAIGAVLLFAFTQSLIQAIFFLDIWHEKGPRWILFIFVSTLALIFIIIFFSIWIMDHLNQNMMP